MRRLNGALAALVVSFVALGTLVETQERIDQDAVWSIRREAGERSQIMRTLHYLTDRYGPRLTGSPNLEAAGRWVLDQLAAWGVEHGRMEPWEFGHPGWVNERISAHIIAPVKDRLVVEALAWTPGTDGPLRAEAYVLEVPERLTRSELEGALEPHRDAVKERIVLVGAHRRLPVSFNPPAMRRDEAGLLAMFDPARTPPAPAPAAAPADEEEEARPRPLTANQRDQAIDAFLLAAGAAVRVNDARREHGQIRAFGNRTYDPAKAPPTLVMRNEDYGRITRLVEHGERPVELEVDVANRLYPEGRTAYNVVAEIPGSERPDEIIMLGGHLDSWHAGTGATDNAIGCAVMIEVMRIFAALDLRPRRTIRLALWSGEEQGLLGSRAYVAEHFGMAEDARPAHARLGGYFNLDMGTGRARGMTVFGPPEAAAVLRATLAPFADLGVVGATYTDSRRRGGSDHTSFNEAGLPGITIIQDPIEYGSHSWHSNLDTYERVIEADAIASATVIAGAVYHLAMRDELLPRLGPGEMPPLPNAPDSAGTTASGQ